MGLLPRSQYSFFQTRAYWKKIKKIPHQYGLYNSKEMKVPYYLNEFQHLRHLSLSVSVSLYDHQKKVLHRFLHE